MYKKIDYYSSKYSKGERLVAKLRYFLERRAKGIKGTKELFIVYLAYIEGLEEELKEEALEEEDLEEEEGITLLRDDEEGEINFTTVFIVSNNSYDVREVVQQLKERRVVYILKG